MTNIHIYMKCHTILSNQLEVVVADDGVIKVTEAIQFMIKFHGHVFEFIAYLADMSDTFDFVIGQKSIMNWKQQLIITT